MEGLRDGGLLRRFWCTWVAVCVLQIVSGDGSLKSEGFAESLVLRPLPDGKVLGDFQFVNELGEGRTRAVHHHFKLFPKVIYQIVHNFRIQEMVLSFTHGRWDHQMWGGFHGLEIADVKSGGVELWAQFRQSSEEFDTLWRNLTHALSGLFCASINFLEDPAMVSKRGGAHHVGDMGAVRQGVLPREAVCTENLTPWLKLLPCGDRAGLSTLLERPRLLNGDYYSLRLHVKTGNSTDQPLEYLRLVQSLTVVLKSSDTSAAPRRKSVHLDGTLLLRPPNWSLSSLFGRPLAGRCPLASSSQVHIELETNLLAEHKRSENGMSSFPDVYEIAQNELHGINGGGENVDVNSNNVFQLNLAPAAVLKRACGRGSGPSLFLNYDVQKQSKAHPLNVGMSWRSSVAWSPRQGPFRATQFLTGRGYGRGSIVSLVHTNRDDRCNMRCYSLCEDEDGSSPGMDVTMFQIVPWYVRLYMHTLKLVVDGEPVPLKQGVMLKLSPADDRKSPAVLEIAVPVPRNASMLVLSVDFDKGYLRIDEHPPDANRGFDLPSALFTFSSSSARSQASHLEHEVVSSQSLVQMHSANLLVMLATPDFSMPYNVITFTMTALALYFGSLLNSLRLRSVREDLAQQPASRVSTEIQRLLALFAGRNMVAR